MNLPFSSFMALLLLLRLLSVAAADVLATQSRYPVVFAEAQAPTTTLMPTAPLGKREEIATLYVAPDNTCGYIGGNSKVYLSCGNTALSCVFDVTSTTGYGGCCADFISCDTWTTCINNEDAPSGTVGGRTLACTPPYYPYCTTNVMHGLGVSMFGCHPSKLTVAATLLTTYIGQTGRKFQTVLPTTPSSSVSPAPDNNGGGGGTPVGDIVGGVIGGVAFLVITAAVLIFLVRRARRRSRARRAVGATVIDRPYGIQEMDPETRVHEVEGSVGMYGMEKNSRG